jgi:putative heme-binding domain-containing protein
LDAALLATTWKNPAGLEAVRQVYAGDTWSDERRLQALGALVAAGDDQLLDVVARMLSAPASSLQLRRRTLDALGRLEDPQVGDVVLRAYAQLDAEVRPQAIELLTGRAAWSKQLLAAIGQDRIPANALNLNQVRKLLTSKDEELASQVRAVWGTLRTDRDPAREQTIARMRRFIRDTPGDPHAGREVFKKVCGQCHKLHGEGQEVGPDITQNGRGSFEQLLSNVFDPSLVIGAVYQARTIVTADGRILTGLLAEDSDQRVVLKVQGGKQETIARDDIDVMEVSKLSMMPEDLEKQLPPKELADLFAYITLDRPPDDPRAQQLPGVTAPLPRESTEPAEFATLVAEVAPGFSTQASGEGGVAIVAEHFGRAGVLRTHPLDRSRPCVLSRTIELPAAKSAKLIVDVSHHPDGDWQLVVKANGETLHDLVVGEKTAPDGWARATVDLSGFAGKKVELELHNKATGWSWEFGYFGSAEVQVDE